MKEGMRSCKHSLPYKIAKPQVRLLAASVTMKCNIFRNGQRADEVSPREAFLGRKADANRDLVFPSGLRITPLRNIRN